MQFNKYTHTHTHTHTVFWTLHLSANLSALAQKARPVACGDVLRRIVGAVFCRRYGRKLADYFQPWGQYGVAVSGGVEIMAFTATPGFKEGCTILSYDGANAFNSIYHHRFLPALAEVVPSVVPYVSNLYAREPPKLLFALDGGGLEVVESARGVQQGCNLGPLCYSAGSLKILKEFRANPSVPGARAVSFIDDITIVLPPELSLDMAATGKVTEWLQERLEVEGISLNRRKSQALLADGVGPEQLTEEQRVAMDTTGLTVVRQGMRVVGVPVGTEQFQRDFLQEVANGKPAELVRALVPMEDAQASFQILRLSATSRLSHLLRTVPHSITCQAAANYDDLVEWALASIIVGDRAAAAGLPTPEEVTHDPTIPLCAKIRPTWGTMPYGRPTCQSEKAALDLPAASPSKARHIPAATPWSWGVSSLPPPGGTFRPFLNGCLSDPWRQRSLKS